MNRTNHKTDKPKTKGTEDKLIKMTNVRLHLYNSTLKSNKTNMKCLSEYVKTKIRKTMRLLHLYFKVQTYNKLS